MPRTQPILPQADASCGKIFFADRRTADGHRIAMEVWNRATGGGRAGYRLTVYRCKRCAGFHVVQMPVERIRPRPVDPPCDHQEPDGWEPEGLGGDEAARVRRMDLAVAAC